MGDMSTALAPSAIAQRVMLNLRYYGAKAAERVDAWQVEHFAALRYRRMQVPAWRRDHAQAIASDGSTLSRLLTDRGDAIADAERLIGGEYRVFSTTIQCESGFPDWHVDHMSGRRYALKPHGLTRVDVDTGSDIICAWELSRLQGIPCLVAAGRATGDDRYRDAFVALVTDWERHNPYLMGVNWYCGLDIAIRALNIAIGLIYFADNRDTAAWTRLRHLLWAHLLFLQQRDLYQRKSTVNNHQLIAAVIHYALLQLFDGPTAKAWHERAGQIVFSEVERQFRPDGGNFESALPYHQFVLESLCVGAALLGGEDGRNALADGGAMSGKAAARLEAALRFSADCCRAWGRTPHIGDSSDGRVLFHRDYFGWQPDDPAYLADWSGALLENDPFAERASTAANLHAHSGIGTFANERYGLVCASMPVTPAAGGHNHLDRASFLLRVGDLPVFVDSGTYCYTSDTDARDEHRRGRAHNVLLVGDSDQAPLGSGVFETPDYRETGITLDDGDARSARFRLWHDGYARLAGAGRVSRVIECGADAIELHDRVEGSGQTRLTMVFQLHPGLKCEPADGKVAILDAGSTVCTLHVPAGWQAAVEPGWYSEEYRSRQASKRLVLSIDTALPAQAHTAIQLRCP